MATAPGAPTAVVATGGRGVVGVTWTAPSSNGATITQYTIDLSLSASFDGEVWNTESGSARASTFTDLTPGTLYYFRVRARNSIGSGPYSATVSATTVIRTPLDSIEGASVNITGGATVSIRSDGAATPVFSLGFSPFGAPATWTPFATLSGYYTPGGANNLALVADALGSLYVVGVDATSHERLLARKYLRTSPTAHAWTAKTAHAQSFSGTGDPVVQVSATYIEGTGASAKASIFVLARRAGAQTAGAISYATASVAVLSADSGVDDLFLAFGSAPSWLAGPSGSAPANVGSLDAAIFPNSITKVAVYANNFAVVNVVNGIVSSAYKPADGYTYTGPKIRVLGVSSSVVAQPYRSIVDGSLYVKLLSSAGAILAEPILPAALAFGGDFADQWDASYDRATGLVSVFYVAAADARTIERVDISPDTYAVSTPVVMTSTLGDASSASSSIRLPRGIVDERRLLLEASNLLTGTYSLASLSTTYGNLAPLAPALDARGNIDALTDASFGWTFGDPNPADTQSAYQVQIIRVSDAVVVLDSGKITAGTSTLSVAGGTLVNGVSYQWQARTYDALDAVSEWSALGSFSAVSTGTVTITAPATDDLVFDTSSVLVEWTFFQSGGALQESRRVRLIRVSDTFVVSDTTLQASTATSHAVTLDSDVAYTVEVTVQAVGASSGAVASRPLSSSYSLAMTPTLAVTVGDSFLDLIIDNPEPLGDRPAVEGNELFKRPAGSDADFVRIAFVGVNGTYRDRAVAVGASYEYQVRGLAPEYAP